MKKTIFAIIVVVCLVSAPARMEIPHEINYQGHLNDDMGVPLTGTYDFSFRLFNAETNGILLWSETQSGVAVLDGVFHVVLGSATPVELDFSQPYWLEITVSGETLLPRQPLTSIGHAYQAQDVTRQNIHPLSVSIDGVGEVISATGQWVGDPTGLTGPVGPTGPAGPQGDVGPVGATGSIGPIGPRGDIGLTGPTGLQGEIGPRGPTGPQGDVGPAGPQGENGLRGPTGPIGPQGDIGLAGPTGLQGEIGPRGPTGPQGDVGPIGPAGPQGENGIRGPTGLIGPQGNIGPTGPQGETGLVGPTGPIGPQGSTGPTGPVGGENMQFIYNNNGTPAGSEIYYDNVSGNVGIGSAIPNEALTVEGVVSIREQPDSPSPTLDYGKLFIKNRTGTDFRPGSSLAQGLVSYWKMDETSGSTVSDSVGSNHGTASGTTTNDAKIGKGRYFDGVDDYVSTNYRVSAGARSYFFWIRFNSLTGTGGHALSGVQEGGAYTYLGIQSGGQGYFFAGDNGGVFNYYFTTNTWYHIGFTMNGTNQTRLYVNGVLADTKSYSSDQNATLIFYMGRVQAGHYIHGIMDEMCIWNRALSAQEIASLYNDGAGIQYGSYLTEKGLFFMDSEGNEYSISMEPVP